MKLNKNDKKDEMILRHTTKVKTNLLKPNNINRRTNIKYVFATSDILESYIYALHGNVKLMITKENNKAICIFCGNLKDFIIEDGDRMILKEKSYIYRVKASKFIHYRGDEWIATEEVPVEKTEKVIEDVDMILEQGVYLFYFPEGFSEEELKKIEEILMDEEKITLKIKKIKEISNIVLINKDIL